MSDTGIASTKGRSRGTTHVGDRGAWRAGAQVGQSRHETKSPQVVQALAIGGPLSAAGAARRAAADVVEQALSAINVTANNRSSGGRGNEAHLVTSGNASSASGSSQPSARRASAVSQRNGAAHAHAGPSPIQRQPDDGPGSAEEELTPAITQQQLTRIIESLEQRILDQVDRRGGRYKGIF
ncbi:MAG: hypothetical protein WD208_00445 [Dehalococcoidia bacterium]